MKINDENLIPMNKRSERERKEIGRKGAEVTNRLKKEKKTMRQLVNDMINRDVDIEKLPPDMLELSMIIGEEKTLAAYMTAGQIKSASQGNTKAFITLTELAEKQQSQEENQTRYNMPILDITSDFVELYRKIHEAFETGNIREIISKGGRGSVKSNFWAGIAEECIYIFIIYFIIIQWIVRF